MTMINPVVLDENSLQPFFVLHKASRPPRKTSGKPKRSVELSPKVPLKSNNGTLEALNCLELRLQTFHFFWSKFETIIKDALRNINAGEFDKIDRWIRKSFDAISSCTVYDPTQVTSSYPLLLPANHCASSKKLFTGLVCTKNLEFVDDILTFEELAQHLKSCGYHVANLSSLDLSEKNGINGCLKNLLRQFITISIDATDLSILCSWYYEQGSCKNPIVVIIDSIERCCESVLSDFIIMLSEWAVKIPVILMLGVTTTVDALRDILPSKTLQHLSPSKFVLESPTERMDAVIASVLMKKDACFHLGHEVASFLRNYFSRQDGTLTSFIRALKMANVQHLILEPSGIANSEFIEKKCPRDLSYGDITLLQERIIKQAFGLPSHQRNNQVESDDDIGHDLSEMQRQWNLWSSLVMCLHAAGNYHDATLLDLYCEVLDPKLRKSRTSGDQVELEYNSRLPSNGRCLLGQHPCIEKCGSICHAIHGLRDLPGTELCQLLTKWEKFTEGISEVHEKIKELQSLVRFEDNKCGTMQPTDMSKCEEKSLGLLDGFGVGVDVYDVYEGEINLSCMVYGPIFSSSFPYDLQWLSMVSRRRTTRANINSEKDTSKLNEKVARLAGCMIREFMQPIECIPLHEVICYKDVDKLQSALMGDPRRRIQMDLLDSQKFIRCSCCKKNGGVPSSRMHDTSIMYSLAQEHGDLINLHDWFQSFKATISQSSMRTKNRLKHSPSPKKRKSSHEPQNISDSSIQARFCRAISELQITGLLKMPSKRRPDFVQRVAFGV